VFVKRHQGALYLFAVAIRDARTTATFSFSEFKGTSDIEVLGENRALHLQNNQFQDQFGPWVVHLYRIPDTNNQQPTTDH
jgi:hypothetical protein